MCEEMKQKHVFKKMVWLLVLIIFCVQDTKYLLEHSTYWKYQTLQVTDEEFRRDFGAPEMVGHQEELSISCQNLLQKIRQELRYFPIPESTKEKTLTTAFENSWMYERTYGGARGHEGVDVMASKNVRGIYPVLSMTDGVITNLGWLEKGGYRIGITAESGTYYYYAHLDSYANLREGDHVTAGELLGYMGDSGYGPEGTIGKFQVHLHVGIYTYQNGSEISLNPYYLLKALKTKKLKYAFTSRGGDV